MLLIIGPEITFSVIGTRSLTESVDLQKVAAVVEWAQADTQPASCTDVSQFVGLANYYHKFVCNFPGLAVPPTASPRARRVGSRGESWGVAEQQSFDALWTALKSAPVPHVLVWDQARLTRLLTDA